MKTFYIVDTQDGNKVIDTVEARSEVEARKLVTRHHLDKVLSGGIVVASETRYNLHYRTK